VREAGSGTAPSPTAAILTARAVKSPRKKKKKKNKKTKKEKKGGGPLHRTPHGFDWQQGRSKGKERHLILVDTARAS